MAKLTPRTQVVLDALDEQIAEVESKLAKYRPLVDELAQLKRTRASLLGERAPAGRRGTLNVDGLVGALRASNEPLTPVELAAKIGADANAVRAHLNRNVTGRYRKEGRGWMLVEGDGSSILVRHNVPRRENQR